MFRKLPCTYVRSSGKSNHPCIETFGSFQYIDANYRLFNLYQLWNICRRDQNNDTDYKVVDDWLKECGASGVELCWYNHTPFVSARVLWDFYLSICKRDLCRSWWKSFNVTANRYIEEHGILAFYKEYDICEFPEPQEENWIRERDLANEDHSKIDDPQIHLRYITASGRKF